MANGETIVSIGTASYVLVSIGKTRFKTDLTSMSVTEVLDIVL